jgi:cytochrome c oxidase cbb3-type subunit 3
MKKIIIVSILVSLVLLAVIYSYVGDIIGDDIVNQLSLLAAVIILALTVGVGLKYVNQMKNDKASGQVTGDDWDGIQEYTNPLPMGWAVSFIGTLIFFIWYNLAGYPVWAYSQIGEYNEEVKDYNAKFENLHKNISNDELHAMGESIFLVNCAPCHGVTGDGMDGKAADLTSRISKESVLFVINNGSNNGFMGAGTSMPSYSWLPDQDKKDVAEFVAKGLTGNKKGSEVFATNCAMCHGADGAGMPYVAPSLKSFTPDLVKSILETGKKGAIGQMPAFKVEEMRLTETQQKAVGTYISNLNE